jgi:hypothetical protein
MLDSVQVVRPVNHGVLEDIQLDLNAGSLSQKKQWTAALWIRDNRHG